jgi:hypothetical protein
VPVKLSGKPPAEDLRERVLSRVIFFLLKAPKEKGN